MAYPGWENYQPNGPAEIAKPNKYHARKVTVAMSDGGRITFDSMKEARRYDELCMLQRLGQVRRVDMQPSFELDVNGTRIGRYTADFHVIWTSGEITIEDTKGFKTRDYVLRRKLFDALYAPLFVTEL